MGGRGRSIQIAASRIPCTLEKNELGISPEFSFYSDGTRPFCLLPQCVPWVGKTSRCLNRPPDLEGCYSPSLAPKAMGEGKEGIQRQQCRDVHQHPGSEAKGKNSDQGGSEEEMPTLETAFLSYPLLHPLAHADKAVCPSVPALLVGDPALPRRQPALCSGTERVLESLTLLCSLISTRLCYRFLGMKEKAVTL